MYQEFFGLKEAPFGLTTDPHFLVLTPGYNEVLAKLFYGLESAKGLLVLTGEVGTGKTTALKWILRRLDSSVLSAYVFNPRLSIEEFYLHFTEMLGVRGWSNKAELLTLLGRLLEDRRRRGLRTILIVDEAHEARDALLEEIRLLLNFESDKAKYLQIVLTGQPELREKLNRPQLRQLKQRVALFCEIRALPTAEEVERYITERLTTAGAEQPNVFTPGAVDFVFQCTQGIPRQINNLCDNAMLAAFAKNQEIVSRQTIEEAAADLDLLPKRASGGEENRAATDSGTAAAFQSERFAESDDFGGGSDSGNNHPFIWNRNDL